MITKSDFHLPWMGNNDFQVVLPWLEVPAHRVQLNNYINQGLIQLDIRPDNESPGRGNARRYSLKNAVEMAIFWALVGIGYKPSEVVNIAAHVVERAEYLATTAVNSEHIAMIEEPMVIFYETKGFKIGPLRAIHAPSEEIAAWVANPNSKNGRRIAKTVGELTGTHAGNIMGFFVFQADYIIRRVLEGYEELTNAG